MHVDALPALLLALGGHAGAVVVGWAVGRRRSTVGRWLGAALVTIALPATAAASPWSLLDAVGLAGAAALGLVAAGLEGPSLRRVGAQLLVGVVLTEVLGRALLPAPPRFPPRPWDGRRASDGDAATACRLLYDDDLDADLAARGAHGRPATLHLGDSLLVFGSQGARTDATRLPGRLGAIAPGRDQINLGVPGSAPDLGLLLAARHAVAPVDEVVVWFFPKNDLNELDRRWPCCRGRPLVTVEDGRAVAACPAADPPLLGVEALDRAWRESPTPLLVASLSTRSTVVAHLRARATVALAYGSVWPAGFEGDDLDVAKLDEAPRWARIEAVLGTLRDDLAARGIRLTVVALPYGQEVVHALGPDALGHRRAATLGALCDRLGVRFVRADDLLPEGADARRWFLGDDIHLTDEGHAELAARVAPRLWPTTTVAGPITPP